MQITIINTDPDKNGNRPLLAKQFYLNNGIVESVDYDEGYKFSYCQEECNNLHDLYEILSAISELPNYCIIRGTPKDGLPTCDVLRRNFNFEDKPIHWMCCDFDTVEAPDWLPEDHRHYTEYLISLLPESMHDSSYICQWSNSAFLSPKKIKAHLWFWLEEARTSEELRRWVMDTFAVVDGDVTSYTVDFQMMKAVQPHYTAKPIFTDGIADPLPDNRIQLVTKSKESVFVPVIAPKSFNAGTGEYSISSVVVKDGRTKFGQHLYNIGRLGNYPLEIWKACCCFAIQSGTNRNSTSFKQMLRDAIDSGPRQSERKARYKSDHYLDEQIGKAIAECGSSKSDLPEIPSTHKTEKQLLNDVMETFRTKYPTRVVDDIARKYKS